jgi:hypothetical protein
MGPAAAAGAVAVVAPGAAVEVEAAAAVAAAAEPAAAPQASPAASAGDGAVVAEPGSYSAPPPTPSSSGAWGPAPPRRIRRYGGASAICPPHSPGCSASWPPPAPSLSRRVPSLRGWTCRGFDRRAGSYRARCRGSGSRDWGHPSPTGPPGCPRRGSVATPGPPSASLGPRTGP